MQTFKVLAVLLTVASVGFCASGNCSTTNAPDGTNTALYYSECDTSQQHQLKVTSVTVSYPDGSTDYPINVTTPIRLDVQSVNNGPQINNLTANVTLQAWESSLGGCKWLNVPTFGLLNGLSGCYNCPLPANSPVDLQVVIDLSQFSTIIQGLLGGGIYGMDIHLKTDPKQTTEIACVHVEAKIAK